MKRLMCAAIFAASFAFCGCGEDTPDPDITRLESNLDARFDKLEGEIETLKKDVMLLAAETKTHLSDGVISPDTRRDPEIVKENIGGLPPGGVAIGHDIPDPMQGVPLFDSGQIVFVENTGADSYLYVVNPDGSGSDLIVKRNDGRIYHPALSPDGVAVAYTTETGSAFVRGVANPGEFQLTFGEGRYPAWSPDGRQIAFSDGLNIFITAVESFKVKPPAIQLTHVGSNEMPTWSPDGMQIAFVSGIDGNDNIFVINVNSTNRIRVTNHPADDQHPDWSPDGKQIAFQSRREGHWRIYLLDLKAFSETQMISGKEPSWSSDGTKLVYEDRGKIYVINADRTINADGTGVTNLTNPHSRNGESSPDWQ